eukprot:CAMPEP_0172811552 /NCGR_PEP_ID=MMETSP1075-20121228/9486_1 /TAXON_ID=2916 /ORGANISM="Ceratium fusus, Strain PA161109" /LENGTH=108 /DNA_ID=CAMNT_0013650989 /DNA_START=273 /DNA_END=599 /DNA_ORIENTATION=+
MLTTAQVLDDEEKMPGGGKSVADNNCTDNTPNGVAVPVSSAEAVTDETQAQVLANRDDKPKATSGTLVIMFPSTCFLIRDSLSLCMALSLSRSISAASALRKSFSSSL